MEWLEGRLEQVKILDFGLARPRAHAPSRVTRTGALVGTPEYMAPEQARGQRDVDPRAGVFSLGCLLFECLTGEPPFIAEHIAAVLAKILFEDPPRLCDVRPDAPEALSALVERALGWARSIRWCSPSTPTAPPRASSGLLSLAPGGFAGVDRDVAELALDLAERRVLREERGL
jgi:serine/threonine protein kinase